MHHKLVWGFLDQIWLGIICFNMGWRNGAAVLVLYALNVLYGAPQARMIFFLHNMHKTAILFGIKLISGIVLRPDIMMTTLM